MHYWILALPRPDMERCIEVKTFGLSREGMIKGVEEGDKVVCYATKECHIIALGTVTKGFYRDSTRKFLADGSYSSRIDFEAEVLKEPLAIRPIITQLSLGASNPTNWGASLRMGIGKITAEDWKIISKEASETRKRR